MGSQNLGASRRRVHGDEAGGQEPSGEGGMRRACGREGSVGLAAASWVAVIRPLVQAGRQGF